VGQRYTLSYTYDPTVATHVESITESFLLSSRATYNLSFGKVETTLEVDKRLTWYAYNATRKNHSVPVDSLY